MTMSRSAVAVGVGLVAVATAGVMSGCTMGAAVVVTGDKYRGDPVAKARGEVKLPPLRGPKRRVAVAEFDNKTIYGKRRLGGAAADVLTTELVRSGRFIMLERQRMAAIMKEQQLGMEMVVDATTAAKVGKMLGAQAVVVGTISKFGVKTEGKDVGFYKRKTQIAECSVDIRIVDTTSAEIVFAESGEARVSKTVKELFGAGGKMSYDETLEQDAMRKAIQEVISKVILNLSEAPWFCSVADVEGEEVILDAGQKSGLKVGTELVVHHLGKEIRSPTTGLVIGQRKTRAGTVRVDGYMGEDASTAETFEGGPMKVGDRCELVE